jgi:hypothetical protein
MITMMITRLSVPMTDSLERSPVSCLVGIVWWSVHTFSLTAEHGAQLCCYARDRRRAARDADTLTQARLASGPLA